MPGEVFLFRRQEDGTFAPGRPVEYEKEDPDRPCYSLEMFAHDWHSDGDLDLLVDQSGRIYFVPNEGSRRKPVFGKARPLEVDGRPIRATAPYVADWGGDGKDDLLAIRNGVLWYRNIGRLGNPSPGPRSRRSIKARILLRHCQLERCKSCLLSSLPGEPLRRHWRL